MVTIMFTNQRKYYDKIIDGYLCTFNSDTHQCVSVLLSTGMNIENWEKFNKEIVGTIDPDYNIN